MLALQIGFSDLPLTASGELVVLILEQDVERRQRSVTAGDVLLDIELVGIAQFIARVHLLFEDTEIVPDHHHLSTISLSVEDRSAVVLVFTVYVAINHTVCMPSASRHAQLKIERV